MNINNTICAISTATGQGAIAIIRLSGENCFEIVQKILVKREQFNKLEHKKVLFSQIIDSKNDIIDDILIVKFFAPHSFTGENMVEIYCHGSLFIQNKILQLLVENTATPAKAGEFSQRAFLNGKMDLSQTEAIADLIASSTEMSHKLAINQMRNGFKSELQRLRDKLLNFLSLLELELDFSEEDVEFADRKKLLELINIIHLKINELSSSFKLGNVLKNGISVTIAGKTNVGKSSLLNLLLNEDKAIVSEIHGTTRDVIEDCININGITFRFIDTAGIRKSCDEIEKIGIQRTFDKIKTTNIVICLLDAADNFDEIKSNINEITEFSDSNNQHILLIFNKMDLINNEKINGLKNIFNDCIFISAKEHKIENLINKLTEIATSYQQHESDIIISNTRHYDALLKADNAIKNVISGLKNNLSGDFISLDIRESMNYLGEITGEITNDEILGNIFKNFCIGK